MRFGPWIHPTSRSFDVTIPIDPTVDPSMGIDPPVNPSTIRGRYGSAFLWAGVDWHDFSGPNGGGLLDPTITPTTRAVIGARLTAEGTQPDPAGGPDIGGGPDWHLDEQKIAVYVPQFTPEPTGSPLPAGAIGVDYRGDGTYGFGPLTVPVDWMDGPGTVELSPIQGVNFDGSGDSWSPDFSMILDIRRDVSVVGVHTGSGYPNDAYISDGDAQLAAKTVVHSDTISDYSLRTYTLDWDPAVVTDAGSAAAFILYTLAFRMQLDYIMGVVMPNQGMAMTPVRSYRFRGTWTPPRYRYAYQQSPRLRQFPRDDALGGAPRQGTVNGSTSVQGSARQGWTNNYR